MQNVPTYDQSAESVKESLLVGWIHRHGIPKVLLNDQGRDVDGKSIREFYSKYGINKRHSSPYLPAGDGEAERTIQSEMATPFPVIIDKIKSERNKDKASTQGFLYTLHRSVNGKEHWVCESVKFVKHGHKL